MKLRNLYKYLADLIFPNRCPCCGKIIKWDKLICEKCIDEFPEIKDKPCEKCGKVNCICETNLQYDLCIAPTYYEGVIRKGILNLKSNNGINIAEYFSDYIVSEMQRLNILNEIDYVTAVPMSKKKRYVRGYNQAQEIAKIISKKINKPVENFLKKTDDELVQHELSMEERKSRVINAYDIIHNSENINDKVILLCDDIITTASTLNECARILKEKGSAKVYCVVLATTLLNNKII